GRFDPDSSSLPSLDSTGKEFVLKVPYSPDPIKITSSQDVHIYIEAYPKMENGKPTSSGGMINFHIEPISTTTKTETQISITGLEIFWPEGDPIPLYLYQEGYLKAEVKVNSEGKYSFNQDISEPHHLWISTEKSTLYIGIGVPSPYYDYDPETRTYTFKVDNYTGTIVVVADHIIIDGNGCIFKGPNGIGFYLYNKDYVTIKNCTLTNYNIAICLGHFSNYNLIKENTIHGNYEGIYLYYESSLNRIIGNEVSSNQYGIYIYHSCLYNRI
ncbi:unnamed protein product, partial [marine sediment metagenome]